MQNSFWRTRVGIMTETIFCQTLFTSRPNSELPESLSPENQRIKIKKNATSPCMSQMK
jgi:hypothetical protein